MISLPLPVFLFILLALWWLARQYSPPVFRLLRRFFHWTLRASAKKPVVLRVTLRLIGLMTALFLYCMYILLGSPVLRKPKRVARATVVNNS